MAEVNQKKKKQVKTTEHGTSESHIYACFEQPQTLEIIKYLSMPAPNRLFFDSGTRNVGKNAPQSQKLNSIQRKSKDFKFQRIYHRQQKFKYAFTEQINHIIGQLFRGYSQAVFIYGTQESKKQKILIGQSQNAGFLLTTLAQIFQYCHEKQIQDQVTVKISCSMFKDGKFTDPFSCAESHAKSETNSHSQENRPNQFRYQEQFENIVCDDSIEGKYLLGCPQIIIRNMRTALKIINLITKKIQERRDLKEQNTENLVFTVKLEIDTAFDKYTTGQVYEYSIPKLYIVKLGNPSVDNTLNGVNKNNQWFINLFNFLQNQVIQEKNYAKKAIQNLSNNQMLKKPMKELHQIMIANGVQTSNQIMASAQGKDAFTQYIKNVVIKGVADIHCFTSINNKMTSNQCLTAFIFNNYLSAYHTKPQKKVLNTHHLKNQKTNYEEQLLNIFTVREVQSIGQKQISQKYRKKYSLQTGVNKTYQKKLKASNPSSIKGSTSQSKSKKKQNFSMRQKDSVSTSKQSTGIKQASKATQQYLDPVLVKQTFRTILSSSHQQRQPWGAQWQTKISLFKYLESIKQFMSCCNLVEYEYAQILSQACQKLSKYIFNEEIEEFFYAKKISLQHSLDLRLALKTLKGQKLKTIQIQQKIIKKINSNIKKVNYELEALKSINGRQQHQQLFKVKKNRVLSLIKERDLLTKIFQYYNTMSFHYIYEDNLKLTEQLERAKRQIQEQFQKRNLIQSTLDYDQIMKKINKGFNKRIYQKKDCTMIQQSHLETLRQKNEQEEDEDEIQGQSQSKQLDISALKAQKMQNISMNKTIQQGSQNKQQQSQKNKDKNKLNNSKALKYKMKKEGDQLDNMFTNSNVGVVRSQFQRRNYK